MVTGRRIVEEEQDGKERAGYGKALIKKLSEELSQSSDKGYSERSLRELRQLYLLFPELLISDETVDDTSSEAKWRTPFAISVNPIWRTVFAKLHWSHYQRVLKIKNEKARTYYLTEAASQNWSVRTLDRNISTLYYQRLLSSQNKVAVKDEMEKNTQKAKSNPEDFIRNPSVLEFLNLPTSKAYTETQLEEGLINNLQQFLLELGRGFAFVARQKHVRTDTDDFYIDLVF